jgi:hypothetical protein
VNHFGPAIAADPRKRRPKPHVTWHLDEVYLKIDGRMVYLWRAIDAEGEVLDVLACRAETQILEKYGFLPDLVTDDLRSYHAAAPPGPGIRVNRPGDEKRCKVSKAPATRSQQRPTVRPCARFASLARTRRSS